MRDVLVFILGALFALGIAVLVLSFISDGGYRLRRAAGASLSFPTCSGMCLKPGRYWNYNKEAYL
jgi:hypothetical protein